MESTVDSARSPGAVTDDQGVVWMEAISELLTRIAVSTRALTLAVSEHFPGASSAIGNALTIHI
jgi:hypothetical protein